MAGKCLNGTAANSADFGITAKERIKNGGGMMGVANKGLSEIQSSNSKQ